MLSLVVSLFFAISPTVTFANGTDCSDSFRTEPQFIYDDTLPFVYGPNIESMGKQLFAESIERARNAGLEFSHLLRPSHEELKSRLTSKPAQGLKLEVGPGRAPVCRNCIYLDLYPVEKEITELLASERERVVGFIEGNIRNIPLDSDSTELVIARHMTWRQTTAFSEKLKIEGLQEFYRILKSGGEVWDFYGYENKPLRDDSDPTRRLAVGSLFFPISTERAKIVHEVVYGNPNAREPTDPSYYEFDRLVAKDLTEEEFLQVNWWQLAEIAKKIGFEVHPFRSEFYQGLILRKP
jgi:SAM-dependent methyltransferase